MRTPVCVALLTALLPGVVPVGGGTASEAFAINASGQVTGDSHTGPALNSATTHAFVSSGGPMMGLGRGKGRVGDATNASRRVNGYWCTGGNAGNA